MPSAFVLQWSLEVPAEVGVCARRGTGPWVVRPAQRRPELRGASRPPPTRDCSCVPAGEAVDDPGPRGWRRPGTAYLDAGRQLRRGLPLPAPTSAAHPAGDGRRRLGDDARPGARPAPTGRARVVLLPLRRARHPRVRRLPAAARREDSRPAPGGQAQRSLGQQVGDEVAVGVEPVEDLVEHQLLELRPVGARLDLVPRRGAPRRSGSPCRATSTG